MPRLLLFRHAKAERARPGEKDHDRALAPRGRADSVEMGRMMAERGERPDLVLCSTSLRTRQTWELAAPALDAAPGVRFLRTIYEADGDYLPILCEEGDEAQSILLVGHNPTMQATAIRLADTLTGADGAGLAADFPTAAVAIFEFGGSWAALRLGQMRLTAFLVPPDND
jgi:phosphohistidine phosphatase